MDSPFKSLRVICTAPNEATASRLRAWLADYATEKTTINQDGLRLIMDNFYLGAPEVRNFRAALAGAFAQVTVGYALIGEDT